MAKLIPFDERNDIVHANPATGSNGQQILVRMIQGPPIEWTIDRLRQANSKFDAASRAANASYHGPELQAYASPP